MSGEHRAQLVNSQLEQHHKCNSTLHWTVPGVSVSIATSDSPESKPMAMWMVFHRDSMGNKKDTSLSEDFTF